MDTARKGFIYALINTSLVGLVKVGRRDRDPELRAQELSDHTGVPTPFLVAYKRLVSDSEQAEAWVHAILDRGGFRLSERREFFKAPLHEVVDAICSYPDTSLSEDAPLASGERTITVGRQENCPGDASPDQMPVWLDLLEEAEAYNYGLGEHLEDPVEAFALYRQAAQLGSAEAYRRIGELQSEGRGTVRSADQALISYKKAISLGDVIAHAKMADLFIEEGHVENELKCWERFLDSIAPDLAAGRMPNGITRACLFSCLGRAHILKRHLRHEELLTSASVLPRLMMIAKESLRYCQDRQISTEYVDLAISWLVAKARTAK